MIHSSSRLTLFLLLSLAGSLGCTGDTLEKDAVRIKGLDVKVRNGRVYAIRAVKSRSALEKILASGGQLSPPCKLTVFGIPLTAEDVTQIADLRVTDLMIESCGLDDNMALEIAKAKHLDSLAIRDEPITDEGLASLRKLEGLHTLDLGRCRNLSGVGFEKWKQHTSLKQLFLSYSGVLDDGLAFLHCFPNLQKIEMLGTAVSERGLMQLASLRHLTSPGFPDEITSDMNSRRELMMRYNAKFSSLHGKDIPSPYYIFQPRGNSSQTTVP